MDNLLTPRTNLMMQNINLATYIELTNKAFKKANKARRRVLIVKDALLRFNLNNIKLDPGNYVTVSKSNKYINTEDKEASFKEFINKDDITCDVCAKGALFCTIVGRDNQLSYNDSFQGAWDNNLNNKPHKVLLKYFTAEQIDAIEIAFEGSSYLFDVTFNKNLHSNSVCFYHKYTNSIDRFLAICENIITNKGTFIP